MTAPEIRFVVVLVTAIVALATDVRLRRIPNWLTGGTMLIGLGASFWSDGLGGSAWSLAGAALGLALLLPFYAIRTMGAGDVKLLSAFGAVLGPQALLSVAVYASVVGGVQSLIILRKLGRVRLTLHQLFGMRVLPSRSGAKAPYAVALSSGACLALLLPPVLRF